MDVRLLYASALCAAVAIALIAAGFRLRDRLAGSAPAMALFLFLLATPVLLGVSFLRFPVLGLRFYEVVLAEALALALSMLMPVAVLLFLIERSRRRSDIRRWQEEIDDLRGWKNISAAHRIRSLIYRLSRHRAGPMDLTRCYLRGMNLSGMNLSRARLLGADLTEANLAGSNLAGADLQGSSLRRAILRRADLRETIFWGADLREATLCEAALDGALLKDADLTDADLAGADVSKARGITAQQLATAREASPASAKAGKRES